MASLYILIATCLPFARRLVAVERLPFDDGLVTRWSRRATSESGCALKLPVFVALRYSTGADSKQWADEVIKVTQHWLTEASESSKPPRQSSQSGPNYSPWCVDWRVSISPSTDATVKEDKYDFLYHLEDGTLVPTTSMPLQSFPAPSVALAIARRIAADLGLPFKHLLLTKLNENSNTVQNTTAQEPIPEAIPAGEAVKIRDYQLLGGNGSAFHSSLLPLDLPNESAPMDDAINIPSYSGTIGTDAAVPLPPRLILSFHVLNEDLQYNVTPDDASATLFLAPLSARYNTSIASFAMQLRRRLYNIADALEGITDIGFETHWAVGARTQGVKWEKIEWSADERWFETEERIIEETIEDDEDNADLSPMGTLTQVGVHSSPLEVAHGELTCRGGLVVRSRIEKVSVEKHRSVDKVVHALSADQLEVFVDEGGWGLEDPTMRQKASTKGSPQDSFPHLFERRLSHGPIKDTKVLHLILYKPSRQHSPLIYLPSAEDANESEDQVLGSSEKRLSGTNDSDFSSDEAFSMRKGKIASAMAQEVNSVHWGWTIPGWGGVSIYNERNTLLQTCTRSERGLFLCNLPEEDFTEILHLWTQQLAKLLGIPSALTEPTSARRRRLAHFDLLRRTLLARVIDSIESLAAFHRVSKQLKNLEIGSNVRDQVLTALSSLEQLDAELTGSTGSLFFSSSETRRARLFALSAAAASSSSLAFHHPRMLGLLYFPAEHTWAVYTPLFGPLAVSLLLAGVKELKRWRRGQSAR